MKTQFTITETRESDAHKRSGHAARTRWREQNPAATRYHNVETLFVGVDGEGITLPDGTHRYVLLGVGDRQITNSDGLEWDEIFDFLWEQFQEYGTKSVAYVGFFLGYDFVQWFKTLPEERAKMLLTQEGRNKRKRKSSKRPDPFPVRYGDWEFDILGSKRFRLRKAGTSRWMHICDTGPFFQKSFLKVIDPKEWSDPIVSQEEYEDIARGKAKRATASLDRDMLRYNARENEILARVLQRLNEGFQSLGIHLRPSQWYGPGQAAQAWLDGRAITSERLQEVTPREVLEHARESYFGGWFEIMAHGLIYGKTHEYDINSAYPYIISRLPCLEHGEWIHNDPVALDTKDAMLSNSHGYPGNPGIPDKPTLVYAKVTGSNPYIGAMLHRDDKGNIYRPHETEGWYWLHEIQAAISAKLIHHVDIQESWTYIPCDCPPPLREVRDIYALRKEVGKKTPLGIACKLVPNSLYGKFAQSVGSPKFANPIYASLITAGCRTIILNAIATHPKGAQDVLMVATDGVYFRSSHPNLRVSGELGDWDHDEKINLCLFKPGVYWDDSARNTVKDGNAPVFKARGVSARDFGKQILKIDDMFSTSRIAMRYGSGILWPKIKFPVEFAMITAVQALQRNDWTLAGTLIPEPTLVQSAEPYIKRTAEYMDDQLLRSRPRKNDPYEPSHPYEKRFGMDDPFGQENTEAAGISPDGLPATLVREALGI